MVSAALWARRRLGAACFAVATAATVAHGGLYWHGLMLPVAPLASALPVGSHHSRRLDMLLGLSSVWLLAWWSLFYKFTPAAFFDLMMKVLSTLHPVGR
jgi:hypothetical protein